MSSAKTEQIGYLAVPSEQRTSTKFDEQIRQAPRRMWTQRAIVAE